MEREDEIARALVRDLGEEYGLALGYLTLANRLGDEDPGSRDALTTLARDSMSHSNVIQTLLANMDIRAPNTFKTFPLTKDLDALLRHGFAAERRMAFAYKYLANKLGPGHEFHRAATILAKWEIRHVRMVSSIIRSKGMEPVPGEDEDVEEVIIQVVEEVPEPVQSLMELMDFLDEKAAELELNDVDLSELG